MTTFNPHPKMAWRIEDWRYFRYTGRQVSAFRAGQAWSRAEAVGPHKHMATESPSIQCQGSVSTAKHTSPHRHTLDTKIPSMCVCPSPSALLPVTDTTLVDILGHQRSGLHPHTAQLMCNTHTGPWACSGMCFATFTYYVQIHSSCTCCHL